jgi:lipopolysaccharide cholinephosphotransferase
MLQEFDKFCKNNDIHFFLTGGTLLGAAREQGFIKWDDDIDVGVTRAEYEKFLDYIQKNNALSPINGAFWLIPPKEKGIQFLALQDEKTGAKIDIFPHDGTYLGLRMKLHSSRFKIWEYVYGRKFRRNTGYFNKNILLNLVALILGAGKTNQQLFDKQESVLKRYYGREMPYYADFYFGPPQKSCFSKESLKNMTEVSFEGQKFMAPACYENYFIAKYGEDWKTPFLTHTHL